MKTINTRKNNKTTLHENTDITWLYAYAIKDRVKAQIQGEVHFLLTDNTLYYKLESKTGVIFNYKLENIVHEIVYGVSSETVAQNIIKQYKKHIINLHFK